MRTGAQTLADFEDKHALWGYVNAVGSKRAFNVCETFAWLWAHMPGPMSAALTQMFARRPRRRLRVASLGGGPASCLLGWAVFERLAISGGDSAAADDAGDADADDDDDDADDDADADADDDSSAMPLPRLHVFDYAPGWAPLVQRTADALGEPICFAGCELTQGLGHPTNGALHAATAATNPNPNQGPNPSPDPNPDPNPNPNPNPNPYPYPYPYPNPHPNPYPNPNPNPNPNPSQVRCTRRVPRASTSSCWCTPCMRATTTGPRSTRAAGRRTGLRCCSPYGTPRAPTRSSSSRIRRREALLTRTRTRTQTRTRTRTRTRALTLEP